MAFPDTSPTDLDIELNLAGTWTNIRSGGYVLDRGITISRGRSDEAGHADPSKLSMTLNNVDGRFSPRNPLSPYYGQLTRNTPVRASVARGSTFCETGGVRGDRLSTPDAAVLDITGDLDLRIDITTDAWANRNLCGKYLITGNQRSWILQMPEDLRPLFAWSVDGTGSNAVAIRATAPIPAYPGRLALRVVLDVDNGASGSTTTFYTSDTISGTWTQLGDPVVHAGTTSIFNSTAPLEVGDVTSTTVVNLFGDTVNSVVGRINAFELRSGIGGTVVANPVTTTQTLGATSFNDTTASPRTWTLNGNTLITNRRFRFFGELSSLPPRWDVSGKDVYCPVEAAGIMRRLSQGASPLNSAIYRGVSNEAGLVAYWPSEDASSATSVASAVAGVQPMAVAGTAQFATSDVFAGSDSLPTINKSRWTGRVPAYTSSGVTQVRFFVNIPSGTADGTVIASVIGTGSVAQWDWVYTTASGGSLGLLIYANDGTVLENSGTGIGVNDQPIRLSVDLTQSGPNVTSQSWIQFLSSPNNASGPLYTDGGTLGRISSVVVGPNKDVTDVTIGHISVHNVISNVLDLTIALTGYQSESATDRFARLCTEEGIPYRIIGATGASTTVAMGVQRTETLLDLLQECADADMGVIYEPRDMLGLAFRTRNSMYNQPTRVTLVYNADDISDALEPTDDDQSVANDITVSRENGSSYRIQQTTGSLSTAAPPTGIGRYDTSDTVNVYTDDQLPDIASWKLHLGTVDEARYPTIGVDYTSAGIKGDTAQNEALLTLEIGDRMVVSNLPSWLPPDPVSQLVQGMTESYGNYQQSASHNTTPESPWHVAYADDLVYGRPDTDGSSLHTGVNTTATSLSIDVTAGPLWTTTAGDFPFDVKMGGEVMTVSNITGSSSPQTFTVARSVNGVVKSHSSGEDLRLAYPSYTSL